MFVKIENYYGRDLPLILNTDNIINIYFEPDKMPYITCINNHKYLLDMEQYEQLCKVLEKGNL